MSARASFRLWLLFGLCAVMSVRADPLDSVTLRKIRDSGVIAVGHRESSVPFSYLNERQQPIGYSIDICKQVIEAVKQQLGLTELTVKWVPVTSATRIPLVANRSIDLECGVTTNNWERQSKVAFSLTFFVAESRLVSKKTQPILRLADLRGQSVVSTLGTTSLKHLSELNEKLNLNTTILSVKDDPEAFNMVVTNRVAAYAMDDVLLRSNVVNSGQAQLYVISKDVLSLEPYGIMLPKGDATFKRVVDSAIANLFKNGEIHAFYKRWFLSPIPPHQLTLGLPMSDALRKLIERPTDSSDIAAYGSP